MLNKPMVIAIIPARGGSKGIPHKNIVQLCGHPLISYSIRAARQAKCVSRVFVSTDDPEIEAVSHLYGAEVIRRPPDISGDKSPSEAALLHVLDVLKAEQRYEPDLVVFLQATSPSRRPEDIDGAVRALHEAGADSVFSACPEHFTGRWRCGENGSVYPVNFQLHTRPMRQDYPVEYLENGSIYVFKPHVLRDKSTRLGGKIAAYQMNPLDSLQVDSLEDLNTLEAILRSRRGLKPEKQDLAALSRIRLLVLDFDGVMTDNRVFVDQDGREAVRCNRGDGLGLAQLRRLAIEVMVNSTETNTVVAARCQKLDIPCVQGSDDKLQVLKAIAQERNISAEEIAYVGNDINDLECMRWAGIAIAPSDSVEEILAIADLVTPQEGGAGVVRQVADWILTVQMRKE